MQPILHGDVDLLPIDKLPKDLKKISHNGQYVLRHGESGHRHVIVAERPDQIEILLDEATGLHYLNVKSAVEITHEEHKTLVIEPGFWQEKSETEYNPFEKQLKKVVD